jgi:hypothetical protein
MDKATPMAIMCPGSAVQNTPSLPLRKEKGKKMTTGRVTRGWGDEAVRKQPTFGQK